MTDISLTVMQILVKMASLDCLDDFIAIHKLSLSTQNSDTILLLKQFYNTFSKKH